MPEMKRVKTYIRGLDELMGGGIPSGRAVLVTGNAGCGKTIFGLQFICEGAKRGERGLYIAFEEQKRDLVLQASQFGWDLEEMERDGLVHIMNFNMSTIPVVKVISEIDKELKLNVYERLVFDSLTILSIFAGIVAGVELLRSVGISPERAHLPAGETVMRGTIMGLIRRIKENKVTAIITSELPEKSPYLSRDTISEFICDGVIRMEDKPVGKSRKRFLEVVKMRHTNHDRNLHGMEIGKNGIVVR